MQRTPLKAQERTVFGKKVKNSRKQGLIPANVYGNKVETEAVFVEAADFHKVHRQVGSTGLIDLKIGEEKTRPVLVRELQHDARRGELLHIDFYQVNLSQKVTVYVPVVLVGDEPESVHLGETVILNPLAEIEIEALPTDLLDKVEVDISTLKEVDDAILVSELKIDREKITVLTSEEEVVIKMAPAVTEEMQALLEEQDAATDAAAEAATEGEAEAGEDGETSTSDSDSTEASAEEEKADDAA